MQLIGHLLPVQGEGVESGEDVPRRLLPVGPDQAPVLGLAYGGQDLFGGPQVGLERRGCDGEGRVPPVDVEQLEGEVDRDPPAHREHVAQIVVEVVPRDGSTHREVADVERPHLVFGVAFFTASKRRRIGVEVPCQVDKDEQDQERQAALVHR